WSMRPNAAPMLATMAMDVALRRTPCTGPRTTERPPRTWPMFETPCPGAGTGDVRPVFGRREAPETPPGRPFDGRRDVRTRVRSAVPRPRTSPEAADQRTDAPPRADAAAGRRSTHAG